MDTVYQIRIGDRAAPQGLPAHVAELDSQTRDVTYPSALDEKVSLQKTQGHIDFEELPSYEESTGVRITLPATTRIATTLTSTMNPVYQPNGMSTGTQGPTPQARVADHLNRFQSALSSYRTGECGGLRSAKRAAKQYARSLYEAEMARRTADRELYRGDRKTIRKELKPMEEALKGAVREAKQDRRSQW